MMEGHGRPWNNSHKAVTKEVTKINIEKIGTHNRNCYILPHLRQDSIQLVFKVSDKIHRVGKILGRLPTGIMCRISNPFDQVLDLVAEGSFIKDGFNFVFRFCVYHSRWWWGSNSVRKDIRVRSMVACEEGHMEDRVYLEGCW